MSHIHESLPANEALKMDLFSQISRYIRLICEKRPIFSAKQPLNIRRRPLSPTNVALLLDTCVSESCHVRRNYVTHEWVMSLWHHLFICHVTCFRDSFVWDTWLIHVRDDCRIWMSHVTYQWVMSNIKESCHISMSHVTCELVMSHTNEARTLDLISSALDTRTYANTHTYTHAHTHTRIHTHRTHTHTHTHTHTQPVWYLVDIGHFPQ